MDTDSISPLNSVPSDSMDVDFPPSSSLESIGGEPYNSNEHNQMDYAVNQDLEGIKWTQNPPLTLLTLVIHKVVKHDKRLNRKYMELQAAEDLFDKYRSLASKVVNAWKARSYRDIRKLKILQIPIQTPKLSSGLIPPGQLGALMKALNAPYKGQAVDAFHDYLQRNNRAFGADGGHKHYGKFCSVVQSSGTGKTRLMLELATKGVCVLYMNIRPEDDEHGYPPRDDIPANILTRRCDTEDDYIVQFSAFFAAVFKCLRMFLEERQDLKVLSNIESPSRSDFFAKLKEEYDDVKNKITDSPRGIDIMKANYREFVASTNLPRAKTHEPKVVIAIDEAHVLHKEQKQGLYRFVPATPLLRAIKDYSEGDREAVWVVFASTLSKVAHFAAPQPLFPSARVAVEGQLLFPPFTQLGWNQNAPKLRATRPDEIAKTEHIIQYGRPLWLSLGYPLNTTILQLAIHKLCGSGEFKPADEQQAFAVLAQRFGLDIAFGHRKAVRYVEASVASQLRVCIKITEDRLWSYTTYPSEPFLSCAAASVLHKKNNLVGALQCLEEMANDGVIDIGQIGELVSRFLWLLAKDFFVRTKVNASEDSGNSESGVGKELVDCQLVSVVEFLEFVFGPEIWEKVPQARKEYQNAYINFSHWVSMGFNIRRSNSKLKQLSIDDWTLRHWERTSAVQCCHNQPLVDKVIPMYFKGDNGKPAGMSQILISDKARATAQTPIVLSSIKRNHYSIAPDYYGLPYIAILVDLGVEKAALKVELESSQDNDQCLRIHAVGLDETTYPFLKGHAEVRRILEDLYKRQTPPSNNLLQTLEDQVRFGWSSEERYMDMEE